MPEREFWEVWSEERSSASAGAELGSEVGAEPIAEMPVREVRFGGSAPAFQAPDAPTEGGDFARLYLNLGRKDGASDDQIIELVASHAGEVTLKGMDIMNTHTYLNVPPDDADRVCAALTGKQVAGRDIVCERAKPRRR